uniref:Uncharacterized protein n=1 Tax=Rhizophora mucronata TaxID=61149 RepID=A0A2P2N5C4_RHIMU
MLLPLHLTAWADSKSHISMRRKPMISLLNS